MVVSHDKGGSVKGINCLWVFVVAFLIVTVAPPVVAQDADLEDAVDKSLEEEAAAAAGEQASFAQEIIVTAKRREESIYEVPVAISAFEGEELLYQGITDLTDIGKFVPNLNVTGF